MTASHACLHCGGAFDSKNKLFAHLRNSTCAAAAAADGLKIVDVQEKVALIIGCSGLEGDWKTSLWEAVDLARGVGTIQGRESYARRGGAPGASFASDAREAPALRCEPSVPRANDVLSFMTEPLATAEQREDWCARANGALPPQLRILGRSEGLPSGFHADLSCLRRCCECILPSWLLAPALSALATEGGQCASSCSRSEDACGAAPCEACAADAGSSTSRSRKLHVERGQGDPSWGSEAERTEVMEQFQRLKGLMHQLQGEHRFHNFSRASKITPGEAVARRHVFKFRVGIEVQPGFRGLSLAVDALLVGQLEAMVGLVVAIQRGLLPEYYLEAALGDETLLDVPAIPEGMTCWSGCIYSKQYHHRLQPLFDGAAAADWRRLVEEGLVARARGACLEAWLRDLAAAAPRLVAELEARRGNAAPPPPLASGGDVPDVYARVLKLLREADASGKWPGISKGREKVILDSTLSENGGGGGSFSVGSMPPPLEEPAGNQLFPELVQCAFELEALLMPGRPPSSTIAINKHAQFLPHVDSGAGAGQGISLIVGLGEYAGGELVVEGAQHDIRYSPLEFCGWTQRHWTLPFQGERFSLVWFTPRGCEGRPGLARRWGSSSAACAEATSVAAVEAAEGGPGPAASGPPRPAEPLGLQLQAGPELLPRLGFGSYQLKGEACEAAVYAALAAGYRLIDTASIYKNEEAVGAAIRRWEAEGPERAGTVQVLSKCSTYELGFEKARAACEASLERLGRDVIDVYLIHWPAVAKKRHASAEHRAARRETWRALEQLRREGRVRAIGVSNFTARHLEQLLEDGVEVVPMVNQLEAHPLFLPRDTIDFCEQHGIAVQAYSPLGGGPGSNCARATGGEADGTRLLLGHGAVRRVAEELGRTPAQVALRWGLQHGFAVIPHSSNPVRIAENSAIFDFSLSPSQMKALDELQSESFAQKFCWDPAMVQ